MFMDSYISSTQIPPFLWDMLTETQRDELKGLFYENLKKVIASANYKGAVEAISDVSIRRISEKLQFESNREIERIITGAVKERLVKMKLTDI